jgi:RNA polymerase sigma-70 factor (ECF subfamily)
MTPDEDLMVACGGGSADAFGELFARYRQKIWAFFRRRVANPARAEELAQDVFVAVLNGAKRYEPRAPFRSYLFGIAFRVLAADRRRVDPPSVAIADASHGMAVGAAGDETLWVRQALARLDRDDREVLMLREFEELSYAEIASIFGLPIGTVRSRLFRARSALRRALVPAARDEREQSCR